MGFRSRGVKSSIETHCQEWQGELHNHVVAFLDAVARKCSIALNVLFEVCTATILDDIDLAGRGFSTVQVGVAKRAPSSTTTVLLKMRSKTTGIPSFHGNDFTVIVLPVGIDHVRLLSN